MTSSLAASLGGGSPDAWARDWLVVAGFPVTPSNVLVVVSWEYAESGGGGGMWNPLNTTQGWPGASNVNSVGVKNYRTRVDGLAANAHVIRNGLYGPVVAAFARGDDAAATVQAIVTSPWGTRHIILRGSPPAPGPQPAPKPPPPPPEVDMYVLIAPNRPARLIGVDGNPKIGPGVLALHRVFGVKVTDGLDDAQYDAVWSAIGHPAP